ncbi:SMP-30/gluconolactonase/LRE family protein [Gorillibacterium sp. CAU 1737]|uniref:SMP-30/gluconolactonase/LRE family protein n=1 Tax=Gorillibacterium sp. CAU 1737 TaxID=3140362 RepID=UPI003260B8A8
MNTKEIELVPVHEGRALLGEGPIWVAASGLIYTVDIEGKKVDVYDPATGETRIISVGFRVGAVVPREQGGLVIAGEDGLYALDPETGSLEAMAKPTNEPNGNRFNDGKCDPKGRFWVGTMSMTENPKQGTLYRLDLDGQLHSIVSGVTISNGLAWNAAGDTFYYIDTPTNEIMAYDYDAETGELSHARLVTRFSSEEGSPDGMTIDAEDKLWVAHWGGWRVSRIDPATGERMTVIPLPAQNVTSCVFAGEDLMDLYITTARTGLSEDQLAEQPHAGGLFRIRPGVRGTSTIAYRG